jgi:Cu/Ag efflux protein CusF
MKKVIIVGIAVVFVLSLFSLTWAQEKVKSEQQSQPAVEKPSPANKPEVSGEKAKTEKTKAASIEPQVRRAGGVVKEVDLKRQILTVHQETVKHDWYIKLKVSEGAAKELANLKPGDLVNIWIKGQMITDISRLN